MSRIDPEPAESADASLLRMAPMIRKATRPRAPGPYAGVARLSAIDLRTRYGRILRATRTELGKHVGANPSFPQKMLVERAAQLTLRLALMDDKHADGRGMTDHDSRTYLAWTATLTRTLRALGLKGAEAGPRTLADSYREMRGG